jgi:hypothetical protein
VVVDACEPKLAFVRGLVATWSTFQPHDLVVAKVDRLRRLDALPVK